MIFLLLLAQLLEESGQKPGTLLTKNSNFHLYLMVEPGDLEQIQYRTGAACLGTVSYTHLTQESPLFQAQG